MFEQASRFGEDKRMPPKACAGLSGSRDRAADRLRLLFRTPDRHGDFSELAAAFHQVEGRLGLVERKDVAHDRLEAMPHDGSEHRVPVRRRAHGRPKERKLAPKDLPQRQHRNVALRGSEKHQAAAGRRPLDQRLEA